MSAPPTDKTFHIWFSLHVFVNFMKKEPSTNSYAIFDYFSQIYETTKFGMIKLHLHKSDIIHTQEYTHVNFCLHVNFCNFL